MSTIYRHEFYTAENGQPGLKIEVFKAEWASGTNYANINSVRDFNSVDDFDEKVRYMMLPHAFERKFPDQQSIDRYIESDRLWAEVKGLIIALVSQDPEKLNELAEFLQADPSSWIIEFCIWNAVFTDEMVSFGLIDTQTL